MKLDKIKWGIIGCGDVAEKKNGPPLYKLDHSSLVAVMRRNGQLAKDYANRHQVPHWYDDADRLINDPELNAVYVATPPSSHAKYAIKAMLAGKPVYVEKPMASTFAECQEMIRVSEQTGMPIFVAYYRRALPLFLKVKELLSGNILGKPLVANIRFYATSAEQNLNAEELPWRVKPELAGAGLFYDMGSHELDFLDFIFGPIIKVHGQAQNRGGYYQAEDTVSASFEFENGVLGNGSWSFVVDPSSEEDTIEILGTKGKMRFSCFNPIKLNLQTEQGELFYDFDQPEHVGENHIQLVIDELRGVGKCPSTGKSAARTSWVMEEIVKDYYHKK